MDWPSSKDSILQLERWYISFTVAVMIIHFRFCAIFKCDAEFHCHLNSILRSSITLFLIFFIGPFYYMVTCFHFTFMCALITLKNHAFIDTCIFCAWELGGLGLVLLFPSDSNYLFYFNSLLLTKRSGAFYETICDDPAVRF